MSDPTVPDDDFLDGCEAVIDAPDDELDDPETAALRPLFPAGQDDAWLAEEWHDLFRDGPLEPAPASDGPTFRAGSGFDVGIADRLRAAGLRVIEVAGWRTRGSPNFAPRGCVDHHTAGPRTGLAPSLGVCINGRPGVPGPLCNIFTARDNTVYVVAAGRANHAGRGTWRGLVGNSEVYGNERENVGTNAEPWRPDQHDTAGRANAALMRGRADASFHCEHREWAPGRKPDAHTVTGAHMRGIVAEALGFIPDPRPEPEPPKPAPNRAAGIAATGGTVSGYWIADRKGKVWEKGGAVHHGDLSGHTLAKPVVGICSTFTGAGYWLVAEDGGVFSFGDALFDGSAGGTALNAPVVGMAADPDGRGYWLAAADGGVFAYQAPFLGSAGSAPLNRPIVAIVPGRAAPGDTGYWLVAADGGVFAYGSARHHGSLADVPLAKPIVGGVASPSGLGYLLVGADGGTFAFGDARYHGTTAGAQLAAPVGAVAAPAGGGGYWLLGQDGGVFAFGAALFAGSAAGQIK